MNNYQPRAPHPGRTAVEPCHTTVHTTSCNTQLTPGEGLRLAEAAALDVDDVPTTERTVPLPADARSLLRPPCGWAGAAACPLGSCRAAAAAGRAVTELRGARLPGGASGIRRDAAAAPERHLPAGEQSAGAGPTASSAGHAAASASPAPRRSASSLVAEA
jgi:hypothetical protein